MKKLSFFFNYLKCILYFMVYFNKNCKFQWGENTILEHPGSNPIGDIPFFRVYSYLRQQVWKLSVYFFLWIWKKKFNDKIFLLHKIFSGRQMSNNCHVGVMISLRKWNAIDRGLDHQSGQTKDYKTGIFCLSAKLGIRIMCQTGATCLLTDFLCFYFRTIKIKCVGLVQRDTIIISPQSNMILNWYGWKTVQLGLDIYYYWFVLWEWISQSNLVSNTKPELGDVMRNPFRSKYMNDSMFIKD